MKYIGVLFISSALTAILYIVAALMLPPAPIAAEYWVKDTITIKLDIAKRYSDEHKIVVAAGSNVLFGLDTVKLANDFGVPVINLGLHAGMSLEMILDVADKAVNDGDTLILPLEESMYSEHSITDWQVRNIIAWVPEVWNKLDWQKRIEAIVAIGPGILGELMLTRIKQIVYPASLDDRLVSLDEGLVLEKFDPNVEIKKFHYSAYHLDSLGNMRKAEGARYHGRPSSSPEENIVMSEKSLKNLSGFVKKMHANGVSVYFSHTPYVSSSLYNMDAIKRSSEKFREDLALIAPVIDDKQDLGYERKYFFDTALHLNHEGRAINTERFRNAVASRKKLPWQAEKGRLFGKIEEKGDSFRESASAKP